MDRLKLNKKYMLMPKQISKHNTKTFWLALLNRNLILKAALCFAIFSLLWQRAMLPGDLIHFSKLFGDFS